jgi:hypothetical protein
MMDPNWIIQEIAASKEKRAQREALIKELEKAFDDEISREMTREKMRTQVNDMRACVVDDAWNRLNKMLRLVVEKEEWGEVVPLLQKAAEFWKQAEARLQELDNRLDGLCEVEK